MTAGSVAIVVRREVTVLILEDVTVRSEVSVESEVTVVGVSNGGKVQPIS
jgi:hypothetical protein